MAFVSVSRASLKLTGERVAEFDVERVRLAVRHCQHGDAIDDGALDHAGCSAADLCRTRTRTLVPHALRMHDRGREHENREYLMDERERERIAGEQCRDPERRLRVTIAASINAVTRLTPLRHVSIACT